MSLCFPGGSDGKESAYNAEDPGSRSPEKGNSNPLQYFLPMDWGAWKAILGGKESDMTEPLILFIDNVKGFCCILFCFIFLWYWCFQTRRDKEWPVRETHLCESSEQEEWFGHTQKEGGWSRYFKAQKLIGVTELVGFVTQSCRTLCDPMGCSPPGSSVHGDYPGKNTKVGCRALLRGIFPTQG